MSAFAAVSTPARSGRRSPCRVVYVSNSASGEYTGRFRWADLLRARGYQMSFVVPTGQDWHVERMRAAGVSVSTYAIQARGTNFWQELRSARELARILRREDPALVHSLGHKANVHTMLAGQSAREPALVLHVTGLGSPFLPVSPGGARPGVRAALRGAYRLGRRRAARVLFENHDDELEFDFVPASQRAILCASGVDVQTFDPDAVPPATTAALRRELGIESGDLVLAFVGRLRPEKGLTELLAAVEALSSSYPNLKLLVVGPEDPTQPCPLPASSSQIRRLGRREDVREILSLTHVLVNPSYREGLPRVHLEAAAMTVPLVTTDAPGCRELVRQAECGILVPPRDVQSLRAAIERLVLDAALRARMGRAGRRLVRERYSLLGVVERLDAIYRSVLDEAPA